ncbi:putative secreted protein [Rhodopirellula maiorica SM1]|uniref:Putative secreted protein n=1 Tax=Rhodopirellula maiorica SM1 TaxID=1265738 RepID=M5RKF4_9BACT|nr:putative secreted protein [Rhodopirellula maiorica]EMI19793.1 putative secreted protein [Rhodopirellula maiorica SM1]
MASQTRLFRRHRTLVSPYHIIRLAVAPLLLLAAIGCSDDATIVQKIQVQRQTRLQTETKQDHLGEVHSLLTRLIELNQDESRRQITYHLNRWLDSVPMPENASQPKLLKTISDLLPSERVDELVLGDRFLRSDVSHLRDAYLFGAIAKWVDSPQSDDPLLTSWLAEQEEKLGADEANQLRTACRFFDWTIRNVALEPFVAPPALQITPPELPLGMIFQGAGYRQTDYQSVWRGTGDALQRTGVFTQLCRQAGITAAMLAIQSTETGQLKPWAIGVLVGENVYLFEPALGVFVPGPDQIGIATLAQARSDAAVMRRLNIPGFYDYPFSKQDVQQNIALLNVLPVGISSRMQHLESRLAGDRRMTVYTNVDQVAERLDAAAGIAGVRIWEVPVLAEVYHAALDQAAQRDPLLGFWYFSRWAIMDAEVESSRLFSLARWRHLHGQFDNDDEASLKGARPLYLSQRKPEFEIADLRIDVDLQKAYGIRRELGMPPEVYDRQVQQAQAMIRLGKQTATYWLSLIQYDDGRYDTAETWFRKRVLEDSQLSHWTPAARYNLGRTIEHLGKDEQAVELYKHTGDIQEHGNRIRARLLQKSESD